MVSAGRGWRTHPTGREHNLNDIPAASSSPGKLSVPRSVLGSAHAVSESPGKGPDDVAPTDRDMNSADNLARIHELIGSKGFKPAMALESVTYERKLGDTELSYFLPSRADGVNDMYLCIGFRAPANLVTDDRVRTIWAILRTRHPLLASRVKMEDGQYDDASYCYTPPLSLAGALKEASGNLRISVSSKDELIDSYLNGHRLLSNDQPAYLLVARDPCNYGSSAKQPNGTHVTGAEVNGTSINGASVNGNSHSHNGERVHVQDHTAGPNGVAHVNTSVNGTSTNGSSVNGDSHSGDPQPVQHEYHFCLCTTHYLGDGMALHKTANEFFLLLGAPQSDADLMAQFRKEWAARWDNDTGTIAPLPLALEEKLPNVPDARFARAAADVDFRNLQRKTIGGHILPRKKHGPRRTIVPTVQFSAEETKKALAACKRNGVTISHVVFALCNLVWAKMKPPGNEELPTMMYSAANVRPYFPPSSESHFFLAITYFNIMLPSFVPRSLTDAQTLWLRSQAVKVQTNSVVKSKVFFHRTHAMARERRVTAKQWAKEDDEKEKGTWVAPTSAPQPSPLTTPRIPSSPLIGLSMLGNLDGIYAHKDFPALSLHTLTTGSRQRGGAMLLFGYTFAGKLWLSLGYDVNGFDRDVVDAFWQGLLDGVREHLLT